MVRILQNKKSFLLLWVMCFMTLSPVVGWGAEGETFTVDNINYEVISENLKTVKVGDNTSYSGDGKVSIMEFVVDIETNNYYSVVEISDRAFDGNSNLTHISISGSVKTIGTSAFNLCESLVWVYLEYGVQTISENAFGYCEKLSTVTLNKGTEIIGMGAFQGTALTTITIPKTVTTIGDGAFQSAANLTTVTCLGATPPVLGADLFTGCTNFKDIYVPETYLDAYKEKWEKVYADCIKTTPDYIFTRNGDGTAVITKYQGPDEVVTIPGKLDEQTVVGIGESAFVNNTDLAEITIPGSVTMIGKDAFGYCGNLATVNLNEGVKTIGDGAFERAALTTITIPKTVKTIGNYSFTGCYGLKTVTLNEGLKFIGSGAFSATSLSSITIPASVKTIGNSAFFLCNKLATVTLNEGTETIEGFAFENTALTTITIPKSVKTIGNCAFSGCENLATVTLNEGLETIGDWAFDGSSSLTSITIPASVKTIGKEVFRGATKLTTITFLGTTPPTVGANLFEGCTKFSHINVPKEALNNYISAWAEYANFLDEPTPPVPPAVWYNVRVPATEGVLFSCQNQEADSVNLDVLDRGSLTFYIKLKPDYVAAGIKVTTNRGEVLLPRDSDNKYLVNNISEDVVVKVEGVHPTGNEAINADQVKVWTSNGELHIQAPAQEKVHIVTFAGALLKQLTTTGGQTTISLTHGAYIVRVGQQSFKVNL